MPQKLRLSHTKHATAARKSEDSKYKVTSDKTITSSSLLLVYDEDSMLILSVL